MALAPAMAPGSLLGEIILEYLLIFRGQRRLLLDAGGLGRIE